MPPRGGSRGLREWPGVGCAIKKDVPAVDPASLQISLHFPLFNAAPFVPQLSFISHLGAQQEKNNEPYFILLKKILAQNKNEKI